MKNYFNIFLALILYLFNSCALYTPSAINTPLFTEKGQVSANFQVATGKNFQAAYAVTDHFAVMANRFDYEIDDEDFLWDIDSPRPKNDLYLTGIASMNELGFGYFNSSNRVIKNPYYKGIFELFGGYGIGNSSFTPFKQTNNAVVPFPKHMHSYATNKIFIQPSFGIKHNIIEMAFTPRITNVFYGKPKSDIPDSLWAVNDLTNINKKNYTFFEPTITARLGYKGIKLQAQITRSFLIGNKNFDKFNTGSSLNLGMIFGIGHIKKKLPQK